MIAADPRWHGQPVLLTACNEFDNVDAAAPFLPLAQPLADGLQDLAPQYDVQVVAASGLTEPLGDGRLAADSRTSTGTRTAGSSSGSSRRWPTAGTRVRAPTRPGR